MQQTGSDAAERVTGRAGAGRCRARAAIAAASLAVVLAGCNAENTRSPASPPGDVASPTLKALDKGADVLQNKPPIEALNAYLNGFHFYSGHMEGQMEAHHYCAVLNDDLIQCVIYDGNVKDAKLMGVEYIVGESVFQGLPPAEKALWHSHAHEVKSGTLFAPGIPDVAEKALMTRLVRTYGKTWHTWHTDQQKSLPLGVPQLMMGFTADGQASAAMVAERDRRFGIDSAAKREQRKDIPMPAVDPGADAWLKAPAFQLADPSGALHHAPHAASAAGPASAASAGH